MKGQHTEKVYFTNYSPDGDQLLSGSKDKTAQLKKNSGNTMQTLEGHSGKIYQGGFSSLNGTILTRSSDNTARLWSPSGQSLKVLKYDQGQIKDSLFSPDGHHITTSYSNGTVKIWDENGNSIKTLQAHQGVITHCLFSPDSRLFFTFSNKEHPKLWDMKGNLVLDVASILKAPAVFSTTNKRAEFAPNGQSFLTWENKLFYKVDLQGNILQTIQHTDTILGATYSPFQSKKQILTWSERNKSRLWDEEKGLLIEMTLHTAKIRGGQFSADGNYFMTYGLDDKIVITPIPDLIYDKMLKELQ